MHTYEITVRVRSTTAQFDSIARNRDNARRGIQRYCSGGGNGAFAEHAVDVYALFYYKLLLNVLRHCIGQCHHLVSV